MMAEAWLLLSSQGMRFRSAPHLLVPAHGQTTLFGFCAIEERTMAGSPEEARARAEAKFQKQQ